MGIKGRARRQGPIGSLSCAGGPRDRGEAPEHVAFKAGLAVVAFRAGRPAVI